MVALCMAVTAPLNRKQHGTATYGKFETDVGSITATYRDVLVAEREIVGYRMARGKEPGGGVTSTIPWCLGVFNRLPERRAFYSTKPSRRSHKGRTELHYWPRFSVKT
ncbi:hypothetical protein E2C01_051067 [Portunus trituberculatus]|uniref:Uncharacterized protein n=1 Tax=Portunus trituberculatus TaxID=210409 RepID=A0A5B7GI28_PORTR|nr:hypothetical protein [Portunus trituberculatus]